MSKRSVEFSEVDLQEVDLQVEKKRRREDKASRFKDNHSLDSDEEDEQPTDKYDVLIEDDIEGQEDDTIDYDEGIKITPFNMKEEMEEGHFDTEGTYIFSKKDEIQDNWMDNIDWVKIKKNPKSTKDAEKSDDGSDDDAPELDKISMYEKILTLVKPGETVMKAIQRLGGKKGSASTSASQKWKTNKQKIKSNDSKMEAGVDKEAMLRLTEFADSLLQSGEFDAYSDTYEKMSFKLKTLRPPAPADADDALDMFADDFDQKEKEVKETGSKTSDSNKKGVAVIDEVLWEYKLENKDDAEIHGPYESNKMCDWVDDGFFGDKGVFVRKAGSGSDFYSSKRIDFDLFT